MLKKRFQKFWTNLRKSWRNYKKKFEKPGEKKLRGLELSVIALQELLCSNWQNKNL
jgi:hypothetical protein